MRMEQRSSTHVDICMPPALTSTAGFGRPRSFERTAGELVANATHMRAGIGSMCQGAEGGVWRAVLCRAAVSAVTDLVMAGFHSPPADVGVARCRTVAQEWVGG